MTSSKIKRAVKSQSRQLKISGWIVVLVLALLLTGFRLWQHHFHDYTPLEALKDLRAGALVGNSPHPAMRFLELRYGPQTDPANRKKALEGFFNVGHIEALYLIVGNRTDAKTKKLVGEVAHIIADYRQTVLPAEKADLGAYLKSDTGRAQTHGVTDFYQSKNAQFRSTTTPVMEQLLTTLTAAQP